MFCSRLAAAARGRAWRAARPRRRPARTGPASSATCTSTTTRRPSTRVAGFDRHADGSLTAMPGSPFAAGGSGTGHPDASQGSLRAERGRPLPARRRRRQQPDLGAADQARRLSQGRARARRWPRTASIRSASASTATSSMSRTPARAAAPATPTTQASRLDQGGHLQAIPDSTYMLSDDSKPGQVLFNGDGTKVAGTRIATLQDRQLHRRPRRAADPGRRLAL